ncbi:MAG TPA: cobalamin-dependent protein [Syntrophorhabdus sp.]|jgi:5-methyltetrahydrofolate--homocysteine methyltransferase|nr:cobalamin-dependent protein [Pseudomonadota bacterium]OQB73266.1 MAG: Methionine synthase [Deltaproteobacteria bacterium ADurb.Bin135]HOH27759.1 cobalamin-dependent protein [Syntrophorhabdus sp.]HPB37941.1 cobalamin-dependent protein [Syntrophorhabdus sp.]HPW36688.1 cobalamin-dependent protein [Syntrophorhabdus sp.]
MNETLINLMADLQEEETLAMVNTMIKEGVNPMDILSDARSAMEIVGNRFETSEYFIPDLMMAGEIMKGISDIVKPLLQSDDASAKKGKVLIGTVAGDIHDIGKDIVTFMLDVSGYDVLDIGIDVPVQTFVDKIREFQPSVVGLSGFLTLAFDSMKKTVEAIEKAGLRDNLKIMIGGGQMDDEVRKYVRADAYGKDAVAAVNLCKQWVG